MVQTAHSIIRPLDRPATEYPTYATILDPLHQSPIPAMILITARHAAPATCTPRDKQTRFSKQKKHQNVSNSNSNLGKSITHHISNQGIDHLVSHKVCCIHKS
jgi:hypothetical protein